jgi:hypothetical protein
MKISIIKIVFNRKTLASLRNWELLQFKAAESNNASNKKGHIHPRWAEVLAAKGVFLLHLIPVSWTGLQYVQIKWE